MSIFADGILIVTCITAAAYCFVLSKRLKNLNNTDEGIGSQIKTLNSALEDTKRAVKELRENAKAQSDRLSKEVSQAKRIAAELNRIIKKAQNLPPPPDEKPKKTPLRAAVDLKATEGFDGLAESGRELADEVDQFAEQAKESPDRVSASKITEIELALDGINEDEEDNNSSHQQLGFLPEQDDDDTDAVKSETEAYLEKMGQPVTGGGDNLLKVERMAL